MTFRSRETLFLEDAPVRLSETHLCDPFLFCTVIARMQESVFSHNGINALVMHPSATTHPVPLILYLHGWTQSGTGDTVEKLQRVKDKIGGGLLTRVPNMPCLSNVSF